MPTPEPRIKIVCRMCRSENVGRDAWAKWDVESQQWVLGPVFDAGVCHDCGYDRLDEVPHE